MSDRKIFYIVEQREKREPGGDEQRWRYFGAYESLGMASECAELRRIHSNNEVRVLMSVADVSMAVNVSCPSDTDYSSLKRAAHNGVP